MQRNLFELVRSCAERHPTRGYKFLGDGVVESDSLCYEELDRACRRIASAINNSNVGRGARAMLLFAPGLEFIKAFWACAYAGVVAVPVPPPDAARIQRTVPRLRAIAADCRPEVILTDGHLSENALRQWLPELEGVTVLDVSRDADTEQAWHAPVLDERSIAAIQYTSGSTGIPKGVVVSHGNFLHNLAMLRSFHGEREDTVTVHWLPLFHDMGLIRGMMSPLHMCGDCIMMPPMQFVQRPYRWLAAASRYAATNIGAPTFGYDLCNRKISDTELESLDLSAVRIAFCSAEPIRASTVKRFIGRFAACGFSKSAFRPSYGLAEATVMVSGEVGDRGPRFLACDRAALRENRFVPIDSNDASAVEIASCGVALGGQEIVTVDAAGRRAAGDQIAEIWVRGPSVAAGYWRNPTATQEVFGGQLENAEGHYLRTGDLGWLNAAGELFVTGRKKDLIIVRGQNFYPHDIESAVERAATDVRRGCVAAFAIDTELGEAVAIVAELVEDADEATTHRSRLLSAIRAAVSETFGLPLHAVVFIDRGTMPKTASGKVQRIRARADFLAGRLTALHASAAVKISRAARHHD